MHLGPSMEQSPVASTTIPVLALLLLRAVLPNLRNHIYTCMYFTPLTFTANLIGARTQLHQERRRSTGRTLHCAKREELGKFVIECPSMNKKGIGARVTMHLASSARFHPARRPLVVGVFLHMHDDQNERVGKGRGSMAIEYRRRSLV